MQAVSSPQIEGTIFRDVIGLEPCKAAQESLEICERQGMIVDAERGYLRPTAFIS